jgi:hypothetical protein
MKEGAKFLILITSIVDNGSRLGEGCLTYAQFLHKFQWQLLLNRCYKPFLINIL